jgi:cytochrome c peroxidase
MIRRHRGFMLKLAVAGALAGALAGVGCGGGGGVTIIETGAGAGGGTGSGGAAGAWTWSLPAGFPTPAVPADNPMSEAKVDLGRFLFFDRRLSGNGTQSCASCHQQDKAFTDGKATWRGSTGEFTHRAAQPLANVAYSPTLTWANPSLLTLEKQMEVPLFGENPVEMGINDGNKAEVLQRIATQSLYQTKFSAAFPGEASPVQWANVVKAIASFQRALISGNSKYDQFIAGKGTLTPTELRGHEPVLRGKGRVFPLPRQPNFNDQFVHAHAACWRRPFTTPACTTSAAPGLSRNRTGCSS